VTSKIYSRPKNSAFASTNGQGSLAYKEPYALNACQEEEQCTRLMYKVTSF